MIFKSHIYDRQEIEEKSYNWPLFFLPLLTGLLGYLLVDLTETLGTTIMILSIIVMFFNLYRGWGTKEEEGKYVGEIVLTGDVFTLHRETVKTSDISDLKIEIGHTKGYTHWYQSGYIVDSGTRSSLEFKVSVVKRYYNFEILADRQLKDLKLVLEELYAKGFFVKEFYLGNRTYLLENLDYEDIQDFKKKYRLG